MHFTHLKDINGAFLFYALFQNMFPSHRALSFIKFIIYFFPTKHSIRPTGFFFLMFKIYFCFGLLNQMSCVPYNKPYNNLAFLTGKTGLYYASLLIFCRYNHHNQILCIQ